MNAKLLYVRERRGAGKVVASGKLGVVCAAATLNAAILTWGDKGVPSVFVPYALAGAIQ